MDVPYFFYAMLALGGILGLTILIVLFRSIHSIAADEIGVVSRSWGKPLPEGKLIAENGEAGYQPGLLMPGLRFRFWPLYTVSKYPWVQIPPNGIGVVYAQVGAPLERGAKTAAYNDALGDFRDLQAFLDNGGQYGIQRPVLPPGTTAPLHPIAFVVRTPGNLFGEVLSEQTEKLLAELNDDSLRVTEITPQPRANRQAVSSSGLVNEDNMQDVVGIVTVLEGPAQKSGNIAGRLGDYDDIQALEEAGEASPGEIIRVLLGSKNHLHRNYQDFEAFLANGGCIGLQHDPLLYGAYLLNPFLVKVEMVPMLVIDQGQVAVIKSYVGLPAVDMSGEGYKFGSIVSPGHMGVWSEPLRTGKYPINPRIYAAEIVSTAVLTLNWASESSGEHNLDSGLGRISAKTKDGFDFGVDLQVLIHVPDTKASKVISMAGTMRALVNEVLQAAVGNYFLNSLQMLGATEFIEKRDEVQTKAEEYVTQYLARYDVEVRGVYIQTVVFPPSLVQVLTEREIAKQQQTTFGTQQAAELARVELERQRGIAGQQAELAAAEVSITINKKRAEAAEAKATGDANVTKTLGDGEAHKITVIGQAEAGAKEAAGLADAAAYTAQREAIGPEQTAAVALVNALGAGNIKVTPDVLVGGGSGSNMPLLDLLTLFVTNKITETASVTKQPALPGQTASANNSVSTAS